jgi:CheY-like chemotaxis protein
MNIVEGTGRIVLVVDDDAGTREAAQCLLEEEGYVVDVAANGEAALARMRTRPTPALVVLDLMMPGMDGPSFLRELESSLELPRVPVILMSASSASHLTSSLEYPLLRKPFGIDELMTLVTTYCPRLWDDEEPTTEETSIIRDRESLIDATPRQQCCRCERNRASTRCVACGEALCKACLDAGPDGRCARCCAPARTI